MQPTKLSLSRSQLIRLLSLAAVTAAIGLARADEVARTTFTPPPPPKVAAKFLTEKNANNDEITRGILIAETNQFSFVLPPGFRCKVDGTAKKVGISSGDYSCSISAVLHEKALEGNADLSDETVREQALRRFPGSKVTDEFRAAIQGMNGPGFELRWTTAEGIPMVGRLAFVPYPGGHLEFEFQTSVEKFPGYQHTLNHLLLSFRTSPIGQKLELQEFLSEL